MWTAIRKQKAASQTISKNISLKWNFQKNCCKDPGITEEALIEVLANDPRPRYQKNPERVYGSPMERTMCTSKSEKKYFTFVM